MLTTFFVLGSQQVLITKVNSHVNFVGTPLHPPQFKMPYQTPSARPEYMPHTGRCVLFVFSSVMHCN